MAKELIKIFITGSSGNAAPEEAYKDRLALVPKGIFYNYHPMVESEVNPTREWTYTTTSPIWLKKLEELDKLAVALVQGAPGVLTRDRSSVMVELTYPDESRKVQALNYGDRRARKLLLAVRELVPSTEYMPAVLLLPEDFEKDNE